MTYKNISGFAKNIDPFIKFKFWVYLHIQHNLKSFFVSLSISPFLIDSQIYLNVLQMKCLFTAYSVTLNIPSFNITCGLTIYIRLLKNFMLDMSSGSDFFLSFSNNMMKVVTIFTRITAIDVVVIK